MTMTENDHPILLPRAYYSASVAVFLASSPETVLGTLASNSEMAVEPPQAPSLGCFGGPRRDAWLREIAILRSLLQNAHETRQTHEIKNRPPIFARASP